MNQSRYIARHVLNLPKSGIRDFFEVVAKMKDVISLGIGEPDHVLHLRDDLKKVADARLGQVDDVPGDETGLVHVKLKNENSRADAAKKSQFFAAFLHTRFTSNFSTLSANFGYGEISNKFQRKGAKAAPQAGDSPRAKS